MLPSEFLNRYGQAIPLVLETDGVVPMRVQPNPDRYLLAFWSVSTSTRIFPFSEIPTTGVGFEMLPTAEPTILTHALHGTMVNLGWVLNAGILGATAIVIEAFMKSTTPGQHPLNGPPITPTNNVVLTNQTLPAATLPPPVLTVPVEQPPVPHWQPWVPSEDVPPGTKRLIQQLLRPGEYRTPTPTELALASQYGWELINYELDGFYAVKLDPWRRG